MQVNRPSVMQLQKVMKNIINGIIELIRSIISRLLLAVVHFTNSILSFWVVAWLIYLYILKDILDVFSYGISKFTDRMEWVYKMAKSGSLLKLLANLVKTEEILECDLITKFNDEALKVEQNDVFETSPAILQVTSEDSNKNVRFRKSSTTTTPRSAICKMINPRKINLTSEDQNKRDIAFVSPVHQSYFKHIFNWNLGRNRRNNSYGDRNYSISSSEFARAKNTIAGIRTPSILMEDRENLIENDTPEGIGCCSHFFTLLKIKFKNNRPPTPAMHYERF